MSSEIRDQEIHRAQQERMVRDTIIAQKVNGAHREAFKTRFPGQVEHCLRLTAERLQAVLVDKPDNIKNIEEWSASPAEILALSQSVRELYHVMIDINNTWDKIGG